MPQSRSSVLIHLVFSTKNRQPLITYAIESELVKVLAVELHNMGCPSLAIKGTSDHIHILFALSRTMSIANVVKSIKGSSSHWIKPRSSELRGFEWQAGYGAFSIGRSQVERVRRYITRQKVHHRKISFQDEFRALLQKYEVQYDEKYVWD
jgi:REP element-mobilizing transposase RayT